MWKPHQLNFKKQNPLRSSNLLERELVDRKNLKNFDVINYKLINKQLIIESHHKLCSKNEYQ